MVFASDSRTNAGVDNVSTFKKMAIFEQPGDRVIVIVNSGNLGITQATLSHLKQAIKRDDGSPHLMNVASMYDAAELVGHALRDVGISDGPHLLRSNIDSSANFIIGGQIGRERMRLFLVYSEGNFIEATEDTPYFQIGETKYGKPVIDRIMQSGASMSDAVKCVLVSFDSTMRSNLSVGLPIDLCVYERDALAVTRVRRFGVKDEYMRALSYQWSEGLRRAFQSVPDIEWN